MKGWENEDLVTRAAPFISNTLQDQLADLMTNTVYEGTCSASNEEGQGTREDKIGIREDSEKEFNFVMNHDNLLDIENQIYLL